MGRKLRINLGNDHDWLKASLDELANDVIEPAEVADGEKKLNVMIRAIATAGIANMGETTRLLKAIKELCGGTARGGSMTTGEFIPEFEIEDEEPIPSPFVPFTAEESEEVPTIDLALPVEPTEPTCQHYLPAGWYEDIVMWRATTTGRRGESIRVLAPETEPLPREQWEQAAQERALIRATWTECYPSGYCHTYTGWALAEGGRLIAWDVYWAERMGGTVNAIFGSGGGRTDIAVYASPVLRAAPTTCPICGQPDYGVKEA